MRVDRACSLSSVVLFGALWVSVADAQETSTPVPTGRTFPADRLPVVLSTGRLRQPIGESPVPLSVITRSMIEASGARHIVDLLRLVPGFQVGRRTNGNPVATYHGIADRYNPRLQLLIDGRPAYVPIYGGIPWSELPLAIEDIERLEMVRAPDGASFGPNAFQAIISITTRAAGTDRAPSIAVTAGGNRFRRITFSDSGSVHDLDYRVSLQAEADEGYSNLPDRERGRHLALQIGRQLNVRDRLRLDLALHDGERIELEPVEVPEDFAPRQRTGNANAQLHWERTEAVGQGWRAHYFYNRYTIDEREEHRLEEIELAGDEIITLPPFDVLVDRTVRSDRHEIELQRNQQRGRWGIAWGGGLRHDIVRGGYLFGDDRKRTIDTQRLFGHVRWQAGPRLSLHAGALAEHNDLSGNTFAPRASLLFTPRPGPHHRQGGVFRLGAYRGVRNPLLLEEEGNISLEYEIGGQTVVDRFIVPLGGLEPEIIDVFDIGWRRPPSGRMPGVDLSVSHERLRDLIDAESQEDPLDEFDNLSRTIQNDQDYHFNVLELQIDARPARGTHLRLAWSHAFGEDQKLSSRMLLPRDTLSAFASVPIGAATRLSATWLYTSDWIWDDVRDVSRLHRIDLGASRRMRLGRLAARGTLRAELPIGRNVDYLERNDVEKAFFASVSIELP